MGVQDLENLFRIKGWITEFNRTFGTNFIFRVDTDGLKSGNLLLIHESGDFKKVETLTKAEFNDYQNRGYKLLIPDLLMINPFKAVIEFQEESKPHRGYLMAKSVKRGHSQESERDINKMNLYQKAGFSVLEIWESEPNTKQKLSLFEWLFNKCKA